MPDAGAELTESQQSALDLLKVLLRETSSPYFSDGELVFLLREADWDVHGAAYAGFLRKAEDDSINLPSGLSVPNNRNYWLGLAKFYRPNRGGILKRITGAR